MAESFLKDVAQSLRLSLISYVKDQLLLPWGLNAQVVKLKGTISTINAVLQDSERKLTTSHTDQDWLNKLRFSVYEADDLFDEILARAERKKLMEGNAFIKEVKLFFSSSNQLFTTLMLALRVKSIRDELDDICRDRKDFGNGVDIENDVLSIQGLGCNNLVYYHDKVVGRQTEKNEIISMLFDSTVEEIVSVIPIVGSAGVGKTTLAQHVLSDDQVIENFDMQLIVDVPLNFRLEEVMEKILKKIGEDPSNCDIDYLKIRLSEHINGKKYILVLDNIWDEDSLKWQDLKALLTLGAARGSAILITTRSLTVGTIMGTVPSYQLQPMSENDSWNLFEKIAFNGKGCHDSSSWKIGQEILGICQNIPLAIRALAGVLAKKDPSSWEKFKNVELLHLVSYDKKFDIMPILKVSYDHLLPSKLKTCFSYCSLFPRGYVFHKNELISLWIAQGFIDPLYNGQSLENAGEEYLATLLSGTLLQDVQADEFGSFCKFHDLMYDLSCSVASGQCKLLSSMKSNDFGRGVHHISIGFQVDSSWNVSDAMKNIKQLRTFLLTERPTDEANMRISVCDELISSFQRLRVLDLHDLGIKELPECVGNLVHLRYLDLSYNNFKKLPDSITLLQNLQYLDLRGCKNLVGLPKDMKKLVSLRVLRHDFILGSTIFSTSLGHEYIMGSSFNCTSYFPPGFGSMTNLHTLDIFAVQGDQENKGIFGNKESSSARLSDLNSLNNLKGQLHIMIEGSYQNMALDAGKANLKRKKNLEHLRLQWNRIGKHEEDEMVLENLQPHNRILKLEIAFYMGSTLPTWMQTKQLASSLPHLTHIIVGDSPNIQHIPSFARLPNLKSIYFYCLPGVEYLESSVDESLASSLSSHSPTNFYPSLTTIMLERLENLMGWECSGAGDLSFPCVSVVKIHYCMELEAIPWCPNMKELSLVGVSQYLQIWRAGGADYSAPKLEKLEVDSVDYLISMPQEYLEKVSQLIFTLIDTSHLYLNRLEKGLEGMTSLRTLKFTRCNSLKSITGIPPQLNTLERLEFRYCRNIFLSDEDHSDDSWEVLKSLRFLKFEELYSLRELPWGIQCITTLESLELRSCYSLREIPDWIGNLCSLERLVIHDCPELASLPREMRKLTKLELFVVDKCPTLADRCQRDVGEDWHKIPDTTKVIIRR